MPAAVVVKSRQGARLPAHEGQDFYEEVSHPVIGRHEMPALPLRFARPPARWFDRPAPTLGQHNEEVLGGLLGVSSAELAKLREAGVIGNRPIGIGD